MFCSRRCNEGRVAVGNRQEEDNGVRRAEKVLKYETWFIICRFASCKFASRRAAIALIAQICRVNEAVDLSEESDYYKGVHEKRQGVSVLVSPRFVVPASANKMYEADEMMRGSTGDLKD